jgi:hypothetical protein
MLLVSHRLSTRQIFFRVLTWAEFREAIRWSGDHNSSNSETRRCKDVSWMSFRPRPLYLKWSISATRLIGSRLTDRGHYRRDPEDESPYLCRESKYSHPTHCLVTTLNDKSLFHIIYALIHRFQNYLGRESGRVVTAATTGKVSI